MVTLSRNYLDVDKETLIELISFVLARIVKHNDQLHFDSNKLTRFHSRAAPGITVIDYLNRINKYTNTDPCCLLILLIYIDRISTMMPDLTITSLTVHRFIITAITVSSKALCDVFCTASHYSKVGGLSLNELNLLEREFLRILDWNLTCEDQQLQKYYLNLVEGHPNYTLGDFTDQKSSKNVEIMPIKTHSPVESNQIIPQSRPFVEADIQKQQQQQQQQRRRID
ncbi:cyclin-domain-containing protein [Wallemia mellicola]|uniref:Cyclin-domain-containing protein n=2 Tax=Wallemia mellicola TaxID=1708541 RepID=A0A4T0NDE2_9BASI|nr:cyclin-domain-containing protein [Wallemia mellicola CBS 633.66]TIB79517.1 hypothetical protein E3Q23_00148 [Wallemia mellicola]EIM24140.1 cyclin-domain-containing protein [Wallemia mellicola CBS 633.66]TIB82723.1 cyclin-domain-containing protein [Wallemia mellicola]TIB89551.1 cyclin-domain-containing protein [Wallemia mellicola]TIB91907.1 cyclin-domain-containing protein [Wallemia mellicola]|eukprot:XP_006955965.1 cyclin-domain-containing protein [Wallemia mellicola CBS 633.66]